MVAKPPVAVKLVPATPAIAKPEAAVAVPKAASLAYQAYDPDTQHLINEINQIEQEERDKNKYSLA